MSRKKGLYQKEKPKGLPLWIGTFGDLMSLLLTFFILLLSMATFDKQKIEAAIGSVQGDLSMLENGAEITPPDEIQATPIPLDDPMQDTLNTFASLITDKDILSLRIIGNMDDVPYKAGSQMDNWDLSNDRALSVAKSLISLCVPSSIIRASIMQVGGDGEFNPRDTNFTHISRAQNRRVDIHLASLEIAWIPNNKQKIS